MNIARHLRSRGLKLRPETVLSIVFDEHNTHCLTESHLDTWWASQTPEQKADLYEQCLGPAEAVADDFDRILHAPFTFATSEAAR